MKLLDHRWKYVLLVFSFVSLFSFSRSSGYKLILITALFYIFLMTNDSGHLSIMLTDHPNIFLCASPFQVLNGSVVNPS